MRRNVILFLIVLAFSTLLGCSGKDATDSLGKISVVTTIFPEYDWVKEITKGADNVEITWLLDDGVDMHSFQPSVDDVAKILSCDMLIYVGGESDEWIENVLGEAGDREILTINLMDVLGQSAKEEEIVEGMQQVAESDDEDDVPEYDEHVWLSLRNAEFFCKYIADELGKLDGANEELYASNVKSYILGLEELDKEYEAVIDSSQCKTILVGDRFPFRYMVDDYGIKYYAAFVGCSADSQASFDTIYFLTEKVNELELKVILQSESSDGKLCETIKNATVLKNQMILTLDSMQSVNKDDVLNGKTYIGIMQDNLDILRIALE